MNAWTRTDRAASFLVFDRVRPTPLGIQRLPALKAKSRGTVTGHGIGEQFQHCIIVKRDDRRTAQCFDADFWEHDPAVTQRSG